MQSPTVTFASMAKPAHSLRGRATTIKPEILQQIAMADKNITMSDKTGSQEMSSSSSDRPGSSGADSITTTDTKVQGQVEKFPDFLKRRESIKKTKSLSTSSAVGHAVFVDEDRASAINRLKSISPPLDLQQARQRRESIKLDAKEIRKASISLIRSRTASRVEAQGRPNLKVLEESKRSE